MKKIFLAVLTTLLMICSLCSAELKVTMLNVGQGDAILIQTSTQNTLIDTSDVDEREKLKLELYRLGAFRLDKIILTHPHADHIGNAAWLLQNGVFKVRSVQDNGITSTSKLYQNYKAECTKRLVPTQGVKAGDVLDLGDGAKFTVLFPTAELVNFRNKFSSMKGDPNNESVVGTLTYGEFSMLFTGDAESVVEEEILPIVDHCDILKAGHHGSRTSSTLAFIKKLSPQYVLISAGQPTDKRGGNMYGHPHVQALENFINAGVDKDKIYWTYPNGAITVDVADDGSYTVTPMHNHNWIDRYLLYKTGIVTTVTEL